MQFRPCIDLRHGKVTQIVGASLKSQPRPLKRARIEVTIDTKETNNNEKINVTNSNSVDETQTNFVTDNSSAYYAKLYKQDGLVGGHVIMLGPGNEVAALSALSAYPQGLQVGGGINPGNAKTYLDAGASHIIVTSYVFKDGKVNLEKLKELVDVCGKDRLVLDLSCRKKTKEKSAEYYVVTDRWQKFTNTIVNKETMGFLSQYCAEFLVHGVDVEGKKQGIEEELVEKLGKWTSIPVTYAGGVRGFDDLKLVRKLGRNKVNITVGSALDIFGGNLSYHEVVNFCNQKDVATVTATTTTATTETVTTVSAKNINNSAKNNSNAAATEILAPTAAPSTPTPTSR